MIEERAIQMRNLIFWGTLLEPEDQRIGMANSSLISLQQ
jgi:hypothetical protein